MAAPAAAADAGPAPEPPATPPASTAGLVTWWAPEPARLDRGVPGTSIEVDAADPAFARWLPSPVLGPDERVLRIPGGGSICRPACTLTVAADANVVVKLRGPGTVSGRFDLAPAEPADGDLLLDVRAAGEWATVSRLALVRRGAAPAYGWSFPMLVPDDAVLVATAAAPWTLTAGPVSARGPAGPLAVALGPEAGRVVRVAVAASGELSGLEVRVRNPPAQAAPAAARSVVVLVVGGLRADRVTAAFGALTQAGTIVEGIAAPTTSESDNLAALLGGAAAAARAAGMRTAVLSNDPRLTEPLTAGFEVVERKHPTLMGAAEDMMAGAAGWLRRHAGERVFLVVLCPEGDPPHLYRKGLTIRFDPEPYDGELGFHVDSWRLNKVKKGMIRLEPRDEVRLRALYDSDIANLAAAQARLLPPPPDTVFVLTSTHGYELFEHGSVHFGHSLHREGVEVPLALVAPGIAAGARLVRPAGLGEVLPAALALAGVGTAGPLARAIRGEGAVAPGVGLSRQAPAAVALRVGPWRIISRGPGQERVFDLAADPGEAKPLDGPPSEVLTLLRDLVALEVARQPR